VLRLSCAERASMRGVEAGRRAPVGRLEPECNVGRLSEGNFEQRVLFSGQLVMRSISVRERQLASLPLRILCGGRCLPLVAFCKKCRQLRWFVRTLGIA
jgi:hypothetical protein